LVVQASGAMPANNPDPERLIHDGHDRVRAL
jgi:hypothetical protein